MKKLPEKLGDLTKFPARFLARLIIFYQKTLSPDHGWFRKRWPLGYCRYFPTCSEYGRQAVIKRGVFIGSLMAVWRVLRCNPWSRGGFDPVK